MIPTPQEPQEAVLHRQVKKQGSGPASKGRADGLRFQTTDEAVWALWDGLALELQALAPSESAADAFLDTAREDFYRMAIDFPEDVFTGVTFTAPRTGKPALGITFSDRFRGHATLRAKRFYGLSDH
jgi:hypothetical protein